jgi:hypothetical protein
MSSMDNWFGDRGWNGIAPRKKKRVGRWIFAKVGTEIEAFCTVDDDGCSVSCIEVYGIWDAKGFDWSEDNLKLLVARLEEE